MCQLRITPRSNGFARCTCGCCGCGCDSGFRRFYSTREERECLEIYRDQLQKELAGLEERINVCKCN